ncbi:MAG: hypothetical protein Q7K98_06790 [Candidatus Omnitrophota bacterium]|nr:hypothetical protein [Candidatus Omnitrophota bacterium]
MELKEFVKKVLTDLVQGVEDARNNSVRDMKLYDKENKTVEFDIAVTVEDIDTKSGKAGIRVLQFAEAGGDIAKEIKNSTVSRIKFGVYIRTETKEEEARNLEEIRDHNRNSGSAY